MNTEINFKHSEIPTIELVELKGGITYPPIKYENFINWLLSLLSHDGIL